MTLDCRVNYWKGGGGSGLSVVIPRECGGLVSLLHSVEMRAYLGHDLQMDWPGRLQSCAFVMLGD